MQKISIKSCLGCLAGFFAVSLLLVLAACTAREDTQRLERLLAEADSMNRNYVLFTTDSAMQQAVALADRHGTNTDRVRARYLLGCAYRDMGEAPQALDLFHQALDLADTTRADCDFLLLAKIHGQAGDLFQQQGLSRSAINEYRLGEQLAWQAKDTLTAILIHGQIGNCYFDMYDYDSVLVVSYQTRDLLLSRGDTLRGNTFLAHPISVHLAREEYGEAKPLLYLYQHKSEVADTNINDPHYKMLYNYIGCYALGTGDYGTASRLFRQLAHEDDTYLKLCGYLGLYNLYKRQGLTDSCFMFSDKYISLNDSVFRRWEQGHTQNVQGLYNYQRHRQQAEQKALEANALRYWLISVIAVFIIVVLFSIILFFLYRLYARARMTAARNAYIMAMVEYLQLKSILLSLPTQNAYLLENLTQASSNLTAMQEDGKEPVSWGMSDKLLLSPLILELHRAASKSRSATILQLSELLNLAKEQMPHFLDAIAPLCPHYDTKVFYTCLLLRLRFSLSEICCLLDIRSQNLYTIRRRLYRRLHGSDGKAGDFDDEIRKMPC